MNRQLKPTVIVPLFLLLSLFQSADASAAVVNSVLNDSEGLPPKIIVLGDSLAGASFTLAGVDIPPSCINDISNAEQHIGYCTESASAVPAPGSYKLVINGTTEFSIYFEQAIVVPAPPPPPPVSGDCSCVTGISASGSGIWTQPPIPSDNFVFCLWDEEPDGGPYDHQVWISGSFTFNSNSYTVSALWDPNNPTYDPANPGNSTSACALYNNSTETYDVSHPVASDQQFKACFDWMLRNGGPCL